jgi:hypothetical protein
LSKEITMKFQRSVGLVWSVALLGATAWVACAAPEPEPLPAVQITGQSGVRMGQTLTLSASTLQGTDSDYAWLSLDPAVATVDAAGKQVTVTPVGPGETVISATGVDSGLLGEHNVVVIALDAPDVVVPDAVWDAEVPPVDVTPDEGVEVGPEVVSDTGSGPDVPALHIPYYQEWSTSGHADKAAEAFRHWDSEDPAVVPTTCAKCHSTPGFRDFIGDDGSAVGSVETAVPVGSTVECAACHNPTTAELDSVVFPSGVEVTGLGPEARCMTCHQGRASTDSVDAAIVAAAVTEPRRGLGQAELPQHPLLRRGRHAHRRARRAAATSTRARSMTTASGTCPTATPAWSATTHTPSRCRWTRARRATRPSPARKTSRTSA